MTDPWGQITNAVKQDLVGRGFLHEERTARSGVGTLLGDKVTVSAVPERIAPLAEQAAQVKALPGGLRAGKPQLGAQLWCRVGARCGWPTAGP